MKIGSYHHQPVLRTAQRADSSHYQRRRPLTNGGYLLQTRVRETSPRCWQPQALRLRHLLHEAVTEGSRRCRRLCCYPTRGGEGSRCGLRRSATQGMIGGYLVRNKRCCPYASHIEAGSLYHRKGCWKMIGGYP